MASDPPCTMCPANVSASVVVPRRRFLNRSVFYFPPLGTCPVEEFNSRPFCMKPRDRYCMICSAVKMERCHQPEYVTFSCVEASEALCSSVTSALINCAIAARLLTQTRLRCFQHALLTHRKVSWHVRSSVAPSLTFEPTLGCAGWSSAMLLPSVQRN